MIKYCFSSSVSAETLAQRVKVGMLTVVQIRDFIVHVEIIVQTTHMCLKTLFFGQPPFVRPCGRVLSEFDVKTCTRYQHAGFFLSLLFLFFLILCSFFFSQHTWLVCSILSVYFPFPKFPSACAAGCQPLGVHPFSSMADSWRMSWCAITIPTKRLNTRLIAWGFYMKERLAAALTDYKK